MISAVALAIALAGVASAVNTIKVDPASHTLVDELGRTRVFHGVNAVYKAGSGWKCSLLAREMLTAPFVCL